MLVEKPKLNPIAAIALKELADAGVGLSHDDVLWVNTAAERVSLGPDDSTIGAWVDMPVRAGSSVRLQPLSIAAEYWLREYAAEWFDGDQKMELLSIAYAMANGRDPSAFGDLVSERAAKTTLHAWQAKIGVTGAELAAAVDEMLDPVKTQVTKEDKPLVDVAPNWSFIVPYLIRYYGGTPTDWLYRRPAAQVASMAATLSELLGNKTNDQKFNRFVEFRAVVNFIRNGKQ